MILPRLVPLILPCLVPSILLRLVLHNRTWSYHQHQQRNQDGMHSNTVQENTQSLPFGPHWGPRSSCGPFLEAPSPHLSSKVSRSFSRSCKHNCFNPLPLPHSFVSIKIKNICKKKLLRKFGTSTVCISIYAVSLGLCKAIFGVWWLPWGYQD